MSYAVPDDFDGLIDQSTLISLTDDENTGEVVIERVEKALERASTVIDSYLGSRYSLPLATTPPILRQLCLQIAGHQLHLNRQESEAWRAQHDNAIRFLEQVAAGKISLGVSDPAGTGDIETMQITAPEPLFGDDELDRY